MRNIAYIASY